MNRSKIVQIIRDFGWMHTADKCKYWYQVIKNRKDNLVFIESNKQVKLPPPYMLFEAYKLSYKDYYQDGLVSAKWVIDLVSEFIVFDEKTVLDWGCGPARIVRHMPDLLNKNCSISATDYNDNTIDWCEKNILNVQFERNGINPPTVFENNSFDFIYGISIFTHLSVENHLNWYNELIRISKNDGIILLTMAGEAFKEKMTDDEKRIFEADKLVIRSNVKEGHRVFAAFHPEKFTRELFSTKATILKHIKGQKRNWGIEQDTWILKVK
jgi:SAM-dependent methyltransferase